MGSVVFEDKIGNPVQSAQVQSAQDQATQGEQIQESQEEASNDLSFAPLQLSGDYPVWQEIAMMRFDQAVMSR